jgi:hypothetical protein
MSNGKRNREVGHRYERKWAKIFRQLGYSYCKTSRQASRLLDDCGVDLAFIPYLFQCKHVASGINYSKLIKDIETNVQEHLPPSSPEQKYPVVVAHRRGKKPEEELIVMKAIDFIELLKHAKNKDV